jgi:hypothetical protein
MKLTEVLASVAIFLIASVAFMGTFTNVRRCVKKSQDSAKKVSSLLTSDSLLRKQIRMMDIPYWKCFSREYEVEKEKLLLFAAENGIGVRSVASVYDAEHGAEGIEVEWIFDGKSIVTREYISQRILDEN